jgi:protein SCO1/2
MTSKLLWPLSVLVIGGLLVFYALWAASRPAAGPVPGVLTFMAKGVVKELRPDQRTIIVAHEAIPRFMEAMTMPFKARRPDELRGLESGDQIAFRLNVSATESWIDRITKIGTTPIAAAAPVKPSTAAAPAPRPKHPLLSYHFTNELGQAVSLGDFQGQALAITFFFTRCPIPEFCPRLSKNFQEASRKLSSMAGAPKNWHFLSVSFDPEFDTPEVLKAYAEGYRYDPARWSFLTGPKDKIDELAGQSDVQVNRENGLINHNFRTLIIDAAGHLQMIFPTSGNLSDDIVAQILKAAAVTNRPS